MTGRPAAEDSHEQWRPLQPVRSFEHQSQEIQMSTSKFNELLTRQVGNEFAASHQYVAVAAWFDGQDLPQLAKHFYRQSLEERNHAMMMVR